ncbi:MAG: hypothetical protein GY788_15315 [bacterium]|nr:hypothetical protein [bacterium]
MATARTTSTQNRPAVISGRGHVLAQEVEEDDGAGIPQQGRQIEDTDD